MVDSSIEINLNLELRYKSDFRNGITERAPMKHCDEADMQMKVVCTKVSGLQQSLLSTHSQTNITSVSSVRIFVSYLEESKNPAHLKLSIKFELSILYELLWFEIFDYSEY